MSQTERLTRCRVGNVEYDLTKADVGNYVEFRRSSDPGRVVFIPEELIVRYVANMRRAENSETSDRELLGLRKP